MPADSTFQILRLQGGPTHVAGDTIRGSFGGMGAVDKLNSYLNLPVTGTTVTNAFIDKPAGIIGLVKVWANSTLLNQSQRYGVAIVAFDKTRTKEWKNGEGLLTTWGTPTNSGTDLETKGTALQIAKYVVGNTSTTPNRIMIPLSYLIPVNGNDDLLYCDNNVEWTVEFIMETDVVTTTVGTGSPVLTIRSPEFHLARVTDEDTIKALRSRYMNGTLRYDCLSIQNKPSVVPTGTVNPQIEFNLNSAVIGVITIARLTTTLGQTIRSFELFDDLECTGYHYEWPDGTRTPQSLDFKYRTDMTQYDHYNQIRRFNRLIGSYFLTPDNQNAPVYVGMGTTTGTNISNAMFPIVLAYTTQMKGPARIVFEGTTSGAKTIDLFVISRGVLSFAENDGVSVDPVISGYTS